MWVLTVGMLSHSRSQISWLVRPAATSPSTSRSRPVRSAGSRSGVGCACAAPASRPPSARPERTAVSRRRVGPGEMTESPACTVRTASMSRFGGVFLSRNPAAPASMAPST